MYSDNYNDDGQHSCSAGFLSEARGAKDRKLNAFASLLGSAETLGLQEPLLPIPEPLLAKLLSQNVTSETNLHGHHQCLLPSLSIKNDQISSLVAEKGISRKEVAVLNLAHPIFFHRQDVENVPVILLNNFSDSLKALMDSRLRSSKNALLNEILKRGASSEAKTLFKILSGGSSASSPISVTTIVTSFRAISTDEIATADEVVLPLVFESTVDLTALGTTMTISIDAPGTITGSFHEMDGLLERVEVVFDYKALLESMMANVRYIVRKFIARAAGIAHKMSSKTSSSCAQSNPVSLSNPLFEKENENVENTKDIRYWNETQSEIFPSSIHSSLPSHELPFSNQPNEICVTEDESDKCHQYGFGDEDEKITQRLNSPEIGKHGYDREEVDSSTLRLTKRQKRYSFST